VILKEFKLPLEHGQAGFAAKGAKNARPQQGPLFILRFPKGSRATSAEKQREEKGVPIGTWGKTFKTASQILRRGKKNTKKRKRKKRGSTFITQGGGGSTWYGGNKGSRRGKSTDRPPPKKKTRKWVAHRGLCGGEAFLRMFSREGRGFAKGKPAGGGRGRKDNYLHPLVARFYKRGP